MSYSFSEWPVFVDWPRCGFYLNVHRKDPFSPGNVIFIEFSFSVGRMCFEHDFRIRKVNLTEREEADFQSWLKQEMLSHGWKVIGADGHAITVEPAAASPVQPLSQPIDQLCPVRESNPCFGLERDCSPEKPKKRNSYWDNRRRQTEEYFAKGGKSLLSPGMKKWFEELRQNGNGSE